MRTFRAALLVGLSMTATAAAEAADDPPKGPAATRVMEFKVVDPFTGEAIPDLPLDVQADGKRSGARTEENGSALLYFPEGVRRLTIWVKKGGFVPTEVSWIGEKDGHAETPAAYTLELEHGTTIGGLIHDEAGQPVKGATVYLLVPNDANRGMGKPAPTIWDYTCSSDAEGRWHCDIVPAKLDDVWIRLTHPDFASDTRYGNTPKPPMDRLRDLSGVMTLKKGLNVSGRVLDAEGKGISRARVAQGSDRWGSHYPDTVTDEQGRYTFANASPGEMVLTVQVQGHAPDLRRVQVAPKMAPVDFTLDRPRTIRLRIVDARGNPVAGAFVAADTWRGCRSIDFRADTNAEGKFVWDSAPADEVQFDMGKEKFMSVRNKRIKADDGEVTITLLEPLRIAGSVVDDKTNEPVAAFSTVVGTEWDARPYWVRGEAKSHEGGRYSRAFDEPKPGHYLEFSAEGYAPHVSRKFLDREGSVTYDVRLRRGEPLAGVVLGPDGKPHPGATVMVLLPNTFVFMEGGQATNDRDILKAQTDAEGKFRLPQQVGKYALAVRSDAGYALRTSAELAKSQEIRLDPWARIEGVIKIGNRPGRDEKIHLDHHRQLEDGLAGPNFSETTTADEEGRFAFERVPAGDAAVARVIQTGERSQTYSHRVKVDAKPGEASRVVIGGTGRPVVGRVVPPDGQKLDLSAGMQWLTPAMIKLDIPESLPQEERSRRYTEWTRTPEGVAYQKIANRQYVLQIKPDGSFRADDVPEGDYDLVLSFFTPDRQRLIASARPRVSVPAIPGGQSDQPLDLGDVKLKAPDGPKP